ncbi:MAG: ATP-binding protein [Bacteroidales bacterium]|nr:ATP-binding protein [Bacteroidales bacterium]
MILGVIIRNFKVYKNLTYIPISNNEPFCSLIGKNGIGKSSILEAFDFYFNSKDFKKNNSVSPKPNECYVVPILYVEKTKIPEANREIVEKLNDVIWNVVDNYEDTLPRINSMYQDLVKSFVYHLTGCHVNRETDFIIPLGKDLERKISFGFFRDSVFLKELVPDEYKDKSQEEIWEFVRDLYSPLLDIIPELFQYVYIPKDIEPENIVRFETLELQTLLDTNLTEIISKCLTKKQISDISQGLKGFVEELSSQLPRYKFKAPSSSQPNLKPERIYKLIIEDFFSKRQLHKEGADSTKDIPLKELSSGEKQQAILTLIHSIVKYYREAKDNLIIAVDEPESSLHISACYEQFEKLFEVSNICGQVIISSHWYGFIPAIPSGSITNITNDGGKTIGHIFNIKKYREEIKHKDADYSKQVHRPLPIDIMLKSSNDFIQSILMSVIADEPYNWLICEGSSDKIYLDAYLKDEIESNHLRIIPVCTASEVKNTYNRLSVLFEELRTSGQIKGKVFLLTDTDAQPVEFETEENLEGNLKCRRIVNVGQETQLVKIKANPKAPNTDIEDALNGKAFNKVLFKLTNPIENQDFSFITGEEKEEIASSIAMDFRESEKRKVDEFLNRNNGNNKVVFAQEYVSELNNEAYSVPGWIQEIKKYFAYNN